MDPSSSSSDSAPDCWDQVDMQTLGLAPIGHRASVAGAEAQCEPLSSAFSHQLNVNAKPFVPNVHAAEFVPFFLRGPAQTQTPSADTTGTDELCSGAGDPQGYLGHPCSTQTNRSVSVCVYMLKRQLTSE
ncbi:Eukaryotic peptide chain release factor GTP-binding subunit ERF3B [Manis javanica]|nr:Eukaryotic peptide chain release factor GTP-binding subunit ERF3B [Manis javanica]